MKKILLSILILMSLQPLIAQSKIGYVNPDDLMPLLKETKKADSLLNAFTIELQNDYLQKSEAFDKMAIAFNKDSLKMASVTKEAKRILLRKKLEELSVTQKKYNELIEEEKYNVMQPANQKMADIIKVFANENGYDVILYSSVAVGLNNGADVTETIKKKLK